MVKADTLSSVIKKKMTHKDPWQADEMNESAAGLDWTAKDEHTPVGSFDTDYASLCRVFDVPAHPCLASRRPKEAIIAEDAVAAETSAAVASEASTIQLRNFVVDLTTLRLMMEVLKRSSDVDTVAFHNAGLTEACIAVLVEGLQHTNVRCLSLDYNTSPPSSSFVRQSTSKTKLRPAAEASDKLVDKGLSCRRNFAGLLGAGSRLKALSLRGNGLDDLEALDLAEAIEENTVLCSLNLFDNKITDVGAAAFASTLRINTVLRGISLARNSLTSASAEAFGLLLAGGYEVLSSEQEKRVAADAKIAAQNKLAADAKKKKKDAKVETRLPLSAVAVQVGGDGRRRVIAGGSRSLAWLNLSENRELGAGGALFGLLSRIAKARKEEAEEAGERSDFGAGAGTVVLQELHLTRCQRYAEPGGKGAEEAEACEENDKAIAAISFALRPTKVVLK